MQAWILHWDNAWPYISNKESYFCRIPVYSSYISHSSILTHFLFWGKQGERGCLTVSTVFTCCFCVRRSFSLKKNYPKQLSTVFQVFFHLEPLHLLLLMSLLLKEMLFPMFTLSLTKQQKTERRQRHKLSPLLCPNSVHSWFSLHILHNHSSVLQGTY